MTLSEFNASLPKKEDVKLIKENAETNYTLDKAIEDLDKIVAMKPSKRDFSQVEHLKGIYFKHNSESDEYDMLILNPYINVK